MEKMNGKKLTFSNVQILRSSINRTVNLKKVQPPALEPPFLEDGLVSKLCTACFGVVGKFL